MSARALLACGAIAPVLFVVTFLIDGATRPGYDPWRNFVSQLSTGERGWVQITNFIVCGLLFIAGAVGLWRVRGPRAATVIIGVLGVCLIVAGIFVTDPGLGYPPGERVLPRPTLHDTIHQLVSLPAFLALGLAPIVAALQLRASRAWTVYSVLSGVVSLTFFAALVVLAAEEERIGSNAALGLIQRISIIASFTWLAAFFARLWRSTAGK
jgi:hypothetical membrane protein